MIYLIDKKEVKLGDLIQLNGLNFNLTQKIVDTNPNMFQVVEKYVKFIKWDGSTYTEGKIYKVNSDGKVTKNYDFNNSLTLECLLDNGKVEFSTKEEYDKQEIIAEAKRRYPEGTKFRTLSESNNVVSTKSYWHYSNDQIWFHGVSSNGVVYQNGIWAEIVTPVIRSHDGVDLYDGDSYYSVPAKHNTAHEHCSKIVTNVIKNSYCVNNNCWYFFSTRKAAAEYINNNKPKIFDYYYDKTCNILNQKRFNRFKTK